MNKQKFNDGRDNKLHTTCSSDNRQISSRELFERFGEDIELKVFQRIVTKIVEDFQKAEIKKAEGGKSFILILSTNDGYYVPKSYDGAVKGLLFYQARILPELARRRRLKDLIKKKFLANPDKHADNNQLTMFR